MDQEGIAQRYLSYLKKGDLQGILSLFADNAIVESPLYGIRGAGEFFRILLEDTHASDIKQDGIFTEREKNRIALLFDYHWTLSNGSSAQFSVVDILEFDTDQKIEKLTIIYDTEGVRNLVRPRI